MAIGVASSATRIFSFDKALDRLSELQPFPAVASRVLATVEDPDCTAQDLSQIIQCDAGLAAHILRVANSSYYGFSGRIKTIDHCVVVLGFKAVRDLAISMASASVFQNGAELKARKQLWHHSLACGALSHRLAAEATGVSPDEAFLGGILHDVGKLVLFEAVPEEYRALCAELDSKDVIEAEEEAFGISHEEIGMECS